MTLSLEKLRLMVKNSINYFIYHTMSLLIGNHDHLLLEQFSKHVGIMFKFKMISLIIRVQPMFLVKHLKKISLKTKEPMFQF